MDKTVLSVTEAQKLLGIGKALLYEQIRQGRIPHVRLGRRILIPRAALERMLDPGVSNGK